MAEEDDLRRRMSQMEDRTVAGGAPLAGGSTTASSGAFDTVGGGDLGGPGARDPGDSTSHMRDPVEEREDRATGRGGARGSFSGLGGGLPAGDRGDGGLGMGQSAGAAQQDQGFGSASGGGEGAGGMNPEQEALRAQAQAQSSADAGDAQDLQDKTRAQGDLGSANNNDSL